MKRKIAQYQQSFKYAFRKNKPLLMLRTLSNLCHSLFNKVPRLRYADLAVTYDCNMSCGYCSALKLKDPQKKEMSIEDYKMIADQLLENGVLIIQLTGGEPLLKHNLEEIIKALHPSKMFISLATNATIATRERLKSFKKAGLDNICISIDNWDEDVDGWQGKFASDNSIKVLELGLEVGLTAMIFTVVSHKNVRGKGFMELIEYTAKKGVFLLVGWAVPTGNWNANMEVLLTDDDLKYLDEIYKKHAHVRTDFDANYFRSGCGAVMEKIYITSYGDVIPCAFLHISFGNIFTKTLREIRENALRYGVFRKYSKLCLAANDKDFRRKHMVKIFEAKREPISLEEAGIERKP